MHNMCEYNSHLFSLLNFSLKKPNIDAFRSYFEQFGAITDIVLMMDKENREKKRNKGYGFVKYSDPSCVDTIMAKKGSHNLDGRTVRK